MQHTSDLIDPRIRTFVAPVAVLWTQGSLSDVGLLLRTNTGQSTFTEDPACLVTNGDSADAAMLLDFGRERNGGVQITLRTANHNPVNVRIRFGESVSEAMGEPNNDHANHDIVFPLRPYGAQDIGNTGFRFVRIDFLDTNLECTLVGIRAVTLMHPVERLGAFHSSDPRLNAIWQTSVDTVHLCMQAHIWDGIKRDRLVWMGDLHPEVQVISHAFGKHSLVPQSLDFVRNHTPLPRWMNGISSFSLWWILIQHSWYLHWGDLPYLREQEAYLDGLLQQLDEQVGPDGGERLNGWRFLDWPSETDEEAKHAGLHALLMLALQRGAELSDWLGNTERSSAARQSAERLRAHVPALLARSKQSASLLALSGLHTAAEANQAVLAQAPLEGLSTFYGYYVLQARAMAGDYDGCLDMIRAYWGGMLDLGATSFWEHFDLSWMQNAGRIDELTPDGKVDVHGTYGEHCYVGTRNSLCHGWAAGPALWLMEHVLGVRILEPGCAAIEIRPHLGNLAEVTGAFPTPYGLLHVSHKREADQVVSTWSAPEGVRVVAAP